jgi:hypothetical protein
MNELGCIVLVNFTEEMGAQFGVATQENGCLPGLDHVSQALERNG